MPFTVREVYQALVVQITGKFLGSIEGQPLKAKIDELAQAGQKKFIIDLSNTEFMDSTGIGILIGSLTAVRRAGGDIKLAGMEKRIRNVFLMTRLLEGVFQDYQTVEEAAKSFAASE